MWNDAKNGNIQLTFAAERFIILPENAANRRKR